MILTKRTKTTLQKIICSSVESINSQECIRLLQCADNSIKRIEESLALGKLFLLFFYEAEKNVDVLCTPG